MKITEGEAGVVRINGKLYRAGFLLPASNQDITGFSGKDIARAKRERSISDEGELYHYTSLDGFIGIVNSKGFWASDNRYLNDSQEVSHGRALAVQLLDRKIKKMQSTSFCQVLEAARTAMSEKPKTGHLVACFSKARDSLEQWRGYTEGTGICIRVDGYGNAHHASEFRPMFFGPDQIPYDVEYICRKKAATFLTVMQNFAEQYAIDRRVMDRCWPDDHDSEYASRLIGQLEYHSVRFKNNAFSQEKEVRLVIP